MRLIAMPWTVGGGGDQATHVIAASQAAVPGAAAAPTGRMPINEVLSIVLSFRNGVERYKMYRASLGLLRFLFILNLSYTVLGFTFLFLAMCDYDFAPKFTEFQRAQFWKLGLLISVIAPLGSSADLLALRGLAAWRRALILPWLIVYAVLLSLLFSVTLAGVVYQGLEWKYLILLLCSACFFSAWKHVRRQYADMFRNERPAPHSISELTSHIAAAAGPDAQANDLPPKYEDLDQPPAYESDPSEPGGEASKGLPGGGGGEPGGDRGRN